MGRPSNRAGFGRQRGSLNPQIFIGGATAPQSPTNNMIWIDRVNGKIYVYDESATSWDTIL